MFSSRIIWILMVLTSAPVRSFSDHCHQYNKQDLLISGWSERHAIERGPVAYSDQPSGFRLTDYRAPVPRSLSGATTLNTSELETLLANKLSFRPLLIDVLPKPTKPNWWPQQQIWLPEPHLTIPSAFWLPEIGFGTINAKVEMAYKQFMQDMTQNNLAYPVVLFCRENCWISWNAAKRLLQYGYQQIYWYPDGMDGWIRNLNDTEVVKPERLG